MPRTLLIILPALMFLPAASFAAQWINLGSARDTVKIEADAGSIHTVSEGKVRLWHRESHVKPKMPDSGAFSFSRLTMLSELQCDKRLITLLQQSYTAADGSELRTESFDNAEARPVVPDSSLEKVLVFACKPRAKPVEAPPPPPAPVPDQTETLKKTKGGKKVQEEPPLPPPPHWNYSGNSGPDKWGSLGKDYVTCSLGQRQSPIDIRRAIKADLPPIQFSYRPIPLAIFDNGHGIRVDTADAGGITVDGERFELAHINFHKPSEERINGKSYDMVAHLVHQSQAGRMAVVAVLMEVGKKEHDLIRTLWTHLPLEQGKPVNRAEIRINPTQLLPAKQGYYTFLGSLTTPPCAEGVLWLVLKTPVQVSKEQLAGFATIYRNNVRPVQPVNNRVIKESR